MTPSDMRMRVQEESDTVSSRALTLPNVRNVMSSVPDGRLTWVK